MLEHIEPAIAIGAAGRCDRAGIHVGFIRVPIATTPVARKTACRCETETRCWLDLVNFWIIARRASIPPRQDDPRVQRTLRTRSGTRFVSPGGEEMSAHWSILVLGLCWLGPLAQNAARQEPFPARAAGRPGTPFDIGFLRVLPGGALPGGGESVFGIETGSAPSQHTRSSAITNHVSVLRVLLGPRFLFRNSRRLTPRGMVLMGGIRTSDGLVVNSVAAGTGSRH